MKEERGSMSVFGCVWVCRHVHECLAVCDRGTCMCVHVHKHVCVLVGQSRNEKERTLESGDNSGGGWAIVTNPSS